MKMINIQIWIGSFDIPVTHQALGGWEHDNFQIFGNECR